MCHAVLHTALPPTAAARRFSTPSLLTLSSSRPLCACVAEMADEYAAVRSSGLKLKGEKKKKKKKSKEKKRKAEEEEAALNRRHDGEQQPRPSRTAVVCPNCTQTDTPGKIERHGCTSPFTCTRIAPYT